MTRLGLVSMACGVLLMAGVASAEAQAVKAADVVGRWEGVPNLDPQTVKDSKGTFTMSHAVVFRADSSYVEAIVSEEQQLVCGTGHWVVAADSVKWIDQGDLSYKAVMKDKQLIFSAWGDLTKPIEAYQRLADAATSPNPAVEALAECEQGQDGGMGGDMGDMGGGDQGP